MSILFMISILGEPVAQGRPRAVRIGKGAVRIHSAPKSAQWEALAADQMAAKWGSIGPYDGPVELTVSAHFSRPKGLLKREGMGLLWHTKKPDLDNVVKSASDALVKAGVIRDDAVVAQIRATAVVCGHGNPPHTWVEVRTLEPFAVVPWPEKPRAKKAPKRAVEV